MSFYDSPNTCFKFWNQQPSGEISYTNLTYFLWDSKTNSKINYYENPKASIHVISSYLCNAYSNFKIWGM